MEKGFFDRFDPEKARFRTFLRVCLDRFVAGEHQAKGRQKRGGGLTFVSLDFEDAEGELRRHDVPDGADMDEYFHQEWVRGLFATAVDALRERCTASGRGVHFAIFERYDLDLDGGVVRPSYKQLAGELGISASDVTNYLAFVRRELRAIVLEQLRAMSGTDAEWRDEARQLLGVELP
jgi:hypothetical protein